MDSSGGFLFKADQAKIPFSPRKTSMTSFACGKNQSILSGPQPPGKLGFLYIYFTSSSFFSFLISEGVVVVLKA